MVNTMFKSLILFTTMLTLQTANAQSIEQPAAQPKFTVAYMPQVQEHLKLSVEQKNKISSVLDPYVKDLGDGRKAIMLRQDDDTESIDKDVIAVLDEKQAKRFEEVYLQIAGYSALSRKEYAEKLSVTEEQKKKLEDAWEHNRNRMQEIFDSQGPADGAIIMTKEQSIKLREQLNKEVEAVLSKDQLDKWKTMIGEKFELKDGKLAN